MEELLSRKNFAALSKEVTALMKSQTWFSLHGYESLMLLLRLGLFAFGLFLFAYPALAYRVIGMIVLSYAYTGIAITGTHETSHLTYVRTSFFNKIWAYFFSDFWAAQSHRWWHYRHVQVHHLYPNMPDKEPKPFYYPWINRYVYFFVIPYLVVFWLIAYSVNYLWKRWRQMVAYLLVMLAGFVFHTYLFTALGFSLLASIGLVFLMRSLMAPLFMHLAVFNHIGLDNPRVKLPWLPLQSQTTRNIKPHWLLNGMGGNAFLECHLEHHLFPGVSNHMLAKIRPLVIKYLKKEGYVYREETYWSCLKNCLRYYHELFKNRPQAIW